MELGGGHLSPRPHPSRVIAGQGKDAAALAPRRTKQADPPAGQRAAGLGQFLAPCSARIAGRRRPPRPHKARICDSDMGCDLDVARRRGRAIVWRARRNRSPESGPPVHRPPPRADARADGDAFAALGAARAPGLGRGQAPAARHRPPGLGGRRPATRDPRPPGEISYLRPATPSDPGRRARPGHLSNARPGPDICQDRD